MTSLINITAEIPQFDVNDDGKITIMSFTDKQLWLNLEQLAFIMEHEEFGNVWYITFPHHTVMVSTKTKEAIINRIYGGYK